MQHAVLPVDAFDLPDWLGTSEVAWTARSSVRGAARVEGVPERRGGGAGVRPAGRRPGLPGAAARGRLATSRRTRRGRTARSLLVEYDGRLTLAVPGTAYSADGALETVGRLAKAVGVAPGRFVVTLRL